MTTNNAILTKLSGVFSTREITDKATNETKVQEYQQILKTTDFSDKTAFKGYRVAVNNLIQDMVDFKNAEKTDNITGISKKSLLERLNKIAVFLAAEGAKVNDKPLTFKNYSITWLLDRIAGTVKVVDGQYLVTVKSETTLRRFIEGVFFYELNALPLPDMVISEKSAARMEKLQAALLVETTEKAESKAGNKAVKTTTKTEKAKKPKNTDKADKGEKSDNKAA